MILSSSPATSTSALFSSSLPATSLLSTVPASPAKLNAYTITGGIVGGLGFFAMVFTILLFWRKWSSRRAASRKLAAKTAGRKQDRPKSIAIPPPSLSNDAIPPATSVRHPDILIKIPTFPSFSEDASLDIEKLFVNSDTVTSSPPRRRPASMMPSPRKHRARPISAIHGNSEHDVPLQRSNSNKTRWSIDSTSLFQSQPQSDMPLTKIPLPARASMGYTPSSPDRRTSRKPVPLYDVSDVDASESTPGSDISPDRLRMHPMASHPGFSTEHGSKPVFHYLIPDILPEVREQ